MSKKEKFVTFRDDDDHSEITQQVSIANSGKIQSVSSSKVTQNRIPKIQVNDVYNDIPQPE